MNSHTPIQRLLNTKFSHFPRHFLANFLTVFDKIYQRRVFLYVCVWTAYFAWFWHKALSLNASGDLVAGHVNIWGDWAVHLTMTTAIAERGINIGSPILIDAPFTYPFFVNAISAGLLRLGGDLISAMVLPSFLFSIGLVIALLWSFKQFFKSWNISMLATTFFLFSGGLGFLYAGQTVLSSNDFMYELLNPSDRYTRIDAAGIKWINVIDSMIIPQRAFAPGFTIGIIALTWIYQWWVENKKATWKLLLSAVLIGLLPIIQTHTFLAVFIILSFWAISAISISFLFKITRTHTVKEFLSLLSKSAFPWFGIAVIVSIFAIPLLMQIGVLTLTSSTAETSHSFSVMRGWLASEYNQSWWFFALQNWGIVPIIALFGLSIRGLQFKKKADRAKQILTFLPFFVLFILANLILFQPFAWDNTKLFIWAHFGFSGLAAYAISAGYHKAKLEPSIAKKWASVLVLCALVFIGSASGALDAYRILRHKLDSHVFLTKEELTLAQWTINNTNPYSNWLTGDQHNHWLYTMTGRQPIMAYRGWLWTHGYKYQPQEFAVTTLYTDPRNNLHLLKKYSIDYVVIGPHERTEWKADEQTWTELFPVIHQTKNTKIFKISDVDQGSAI